VTAAAVRTARRLADELLFPAAADVEGAGEVPRSHLDALAAAGLYGIAGPPDVGLALEPSEAGAVVEALASGCLSTAFVWIQHHGSVRALVASGDAQIRARWLARLCRGDVRAGVAIAGIRPGIEPLRSQAVDGGWRLDGSVPWVTGWGRVDVVHTATVDDSGDVRWLLVDAADAPTLRTTRQRLVAVDASSTVDVVFDGHVVPDDRVTRVTSYEEWSAADAAGLRPNGSLALGVVSRALGLAEEGGVDVSAERAEADDLRRRLYDVDDADVPAVRAGASELAWRSAGLLVTAHGARSVLAGQTANRLAREAIFLQVFGSRAPIKAELLRRLARR
jgi:alkylation response protein AidB-like acyl-CoA dehydrogenase